MTKPEYSNKRPLRYSQWHRTLSDKCYVTNIDWIEVRGDEIKAVIEEKSLRSDQKPYLSNFQKTTMLKIADALSVPCYVVYHNLETQVNEGKFDFILVNLRTQETQVFNNEEYKKFIEKL